MPIYEKGTGVFAGLIVTGTASLADFDVRSQPAINDIIISGTGSVGGSWNVRSLTTTNNFVATGAGSIAGAVNIDDVLAVTGAVSLAGATNVDDALTVSSRITAQNITGSAVFRGFTTIASGDAFVGVATTAANSGIPILVTGQTNIASSQQIVFTTNSVVNGTSFAIVPHEAPSETLKVSWFIME